MFVKKILGFIKNIFTFALTIDFHDCTYEYRIDNSHSRHHYGDYYYYRDYHAIMEVG